MKAALKKNLPAIAPIEGLIHIVRGQKVMLDEDLARLYEVDTKALNQAVKRNPTRFPSDFMFQMTWDEDESLRSQIVTLNKGRGKHRKYAPLAFTEHGVAMLSSVLRSPRAVEMNIQIMRAFIRMRELIATNKDLAARIEKLEDKNERTDSVIEMLVEDIDKMSRDIHWIKNPPLKPKHRMGFHTGKEAEG